MTLQREEKEKNPLPDCAGEGFFQRKELGVSYINEPLLLLLRSGGSLINACGVRGRAVGRLRLLPRHFDVTRVDEVVEQVVPELIDLHGRLRLRQRHACGLRGRDAGEQ